MSVHEPSDERAPVERRLAERARAWGVLVEETRETESSLLAFGRRGGRRVVLKVVRRDGDEWRQGDVLHAFAGCGVVRALEWTDGALLLECLRPAHALGDLARAGQDDDATRVIADVVGCMTSASAPAHAPPVEQWGLGLDRWLASDGAQLPRELVADARDRWAELCATQGDVRLLHGDLHHDNVLFDEEGGWMAIDPKGVTGETAYECGAMLRNPWDRPELFTSPATIERRVVLLSSALEIDPDRVLGWAFAQAVLSVLWTVEDGGTVRADEPALRLAGVLRPMLR